MRNKWLQKARKVLCAAVMAFCLLCLLGCTGTVDCGGDLNEYAVRGTVLLVIAVAAGAAGGIFG